MKRYFEFVGEDSSRGVAQSAKFWEAWVEGSTLYTRFGKIGANGQTTMKDFSSPDEAVAALDKAITAKVKKGYREGAAGSPEDEASEDSLENDARALIAQCSSPKTTSRQIDSILDAHETCAEWEGKCPVCNYLADDDADIPDDLWGENVFTALSRRAGLSAEQQDRIVSAGVTAGPDEALLVSIIPNVIERASVVGPESEMVLLEPFEFVGTVLDDDYESWAQDVLEKLRANSTFTAEDVDHFVNYHSEFDFELDGGDAEDDDLVEENSSQVCGSCGKELPANARFCSECGGQAVSSVNSCSRCGEELDSNARFCPQCGTATSSQVAPDDDVDDDDDDTIDDESEDTAAVAGWMMNAIEAMSRNRKIKRVDFLAGAKSTLVFSVEFSGDDFDLRLHKKLLDLDTLLGEGYPEFTDPDPLEPKLYLHAYWGDEDFAELGPEIVEDIVRMVASHEWVKTTTTVGVLREKVEVEKWA